MPKHLIDFAEKNASPLRKPKGEAHGL